MHWVSTFFCRGKIRSLASSLPNCLFVSRNSYSFDSYWRGDHETVLPNSLWSYMYLKSFNHCGVVPGFHFSSNCPVSASKPQFNCRHLTHRCCYSHHLLHHGLGTLCQPTKATLYLLWTPVYAIIIFFFVSGIECTWNCSLFFQRPQFGPWSSGNHELPRNCFSFTLEFISFLFK